MIDGIRRNAIVRVLTVKVQNTAVKHLRAAIRVNLKIAQQRSIALRILHPAGECIVVHAAGIIARNIRGNRPVPDF